MKRSLRVAAIVVGAWACVAQSQRACARMGDVFSAIPMISSTARHCEWRTFSPHSGTALQAKTLFNRHARRHGRFVIRDTGDQARDAHRSPGNHRPILPLVGRPLDPLIHPPA